MTLNEILHYWIVWIFGIIGMLLLWIIKKPYQQYIQYKIEREQEKKKEQEWGREAFKSEMKDAFKKSISEADANILKHTDARDDLLAKGQEQLLKYVKEQDAKMEANQLRIENELKITQKGVLSIQEKAFHEECKKLLEADSIGFDEFQKCTKDHKVYNDLGGNSTGDELFKLVEEKFKKEV